MTSAAALTLSTGRVPTTVDLLKARSFLERHYLRTPLNPAPILSREHGCDIYVKFENHGPIRSFKARGAMYRLSLLSPAERRKGVVTASTGNHGQGIALAGRLLGVPTAVIVPDGTPHLKSDNIGFLGAELQVHGESLAEAEDVARSIAAATGRVYIEDGDDAGLMAGASTVAWEILDQMPDADTIIVPVGGGNLIAGMALVAKLVRPDITIIGVQSDAAPAVYESWRQGIIVEAPSQTFAGGLATARPGRLAFSVLKDLVDRMVLVGEDDLRRAVVTVLESTGQLAEGAGAASFAALPALRQDLSGRKVVLLLSGGNIPVEDLKQLINA